MTTRIVFALAAVFAMHQAVAQAGAGLDDANLVSAESLADHALVDAALADTIVESRPYLNAMDLDRALSGVLAEEDRQALYASVFRQINLNTASREEIMLIPGMSDRMAHEFEEYRPYRSMEQFRREIGKYVDDDEVGQTSLERIERGLTGFVVIHDVALAAKRRCVVFPDCCLVFDDGYSFGHW